MTPAPYALRAAGQTNPCGLPVVPPRLGWICGDDRPAEVQSAWQIQAASAADLLAIAPDQWDSGIVEGDGCGGVSWGGRPLPARSRIWWRVRTFDSDGIASAWSEPAFFEVSIGVEDWSADWIAPPLHGSRLQSPPVPLLRRRFRVGFMPAKARLYLAVAGSCRIWINERELPLTEIPSGYTDYCRRIGYRCIDVDGLVKPGANSLTVLLGDGWFSGFADGRTREHFGSRPELRAQLELSGPAGETCTVCSDAQWEWRSSPLLQADLSLGAAMDGRAFGNHAEYARQKRQWLPVEVVGRPQRRLFPTSLPGVVQAPVAVPGRIERRGNTAGGANRWWVSFPQSVVGRVQLTLHGEPGSYVRLRYALRLLPDGRPDFDDAVIDDYTLGGDEPREIASLPFTRRAFRHVEVTGDLGARGLIAAEGLGLGLQMPGLVQFASDHPLLERLMRRFDRTIDLLCQEVAWCGVCADARFMQPARLHPIAGPLLLQRALEVPLRAWLEECLASEAEPAGVPPVVPPLHRAVESPAGISAAGSPGPESEVVPGAGEAVVALALALFRYSADRSVLEQVFPFARRLVFALERAWPSLIRPLVPAEGIGSRIDAEIAGTALYHACIADTARVAELLELGAQAESLRQLADRVQAAFVSRFVSPAGLLVTDNQDAYVAALGYGLLAEEAGAVAFERLCTLVAESGFRCTTHPLHGARLLDVLAARGREDLAFAVALRLGDGTWLGEAESADDLLLDGRGQVSLEAGALAGWLVTSVAGLCPDAAAPDGGAGWRRACITPRVPVGVSFPEGPPLRHLGVRVQTPAGAWRVEWRVRGQSVLLQVDVPVGCSARVQLPDGSHKRVVAGSHAFTVDVRVDDDRIPVLSETL